MNMRIVGLPLFALAFAGSAACMDITVTRFDDPVPVPCQPNDCSLREAVIYTNNLLGADRILLASGTYVLTQPGAGEDGSYTGDLDVRDDLTIQGVAPALGATAIQMVLPQHDRVLQLYASAAGPRHHLTLNDLTLSSGYATVADNQSLDYPGYGGCLLAKGQLDLNHVTLTQCEAGIGGGLQLDSYAGSSLQHVTISSNAATFSGGGAAIGNSSGTISLRDVIVDNNVIENPDWDSGGGLLMTLTGSGHVIEQLVLSNNSARRCGGGWIEGWPSGPMKTITIVDNVAHGNGGGLCLSNYSNFVSADLYDANISGNHADLDGGGLYVYASGSAADSVRVRVHNSQISGNSAGVGNNGGNGGGIAFMPCSNCAPTANSLALIDSRISNNDAIVFIDNITGGAGGGVYSAQPVTVLRSTFSGNHASLRGGGASLVDAVEPSRIDSSTFDNNATTATSGNTGGGALDVGATSVDIVNSTFDADSSLYGGVVYNRASNVQVRQSTLTKGNNPAGFQGSLLYALAGSSTTFTNTLLAGTCAGLPPSAAAGNMEAGNGLTNSCNLSGSSQPNIALGSLALAALANNGGATATRLPGAGSSMLGAADASQCPSLDQRGYARPSAAVCDIGAVQVAAEDDVVFRDGLELIY